uniref:Uncharacterized protein n=1 Tax=Arundo donax TaxID=35708 RepID=A0A0A9DP52_ARUDO
MPSSSNDSSLQPRDFGQVGAVSFDLHVRPWICHWSRKQQQEHLGLVQACGSHQYHLLMYLLFLGWHLPS